MMWRLAWSWIRLLMVQASWNYDRMQGIGIAFAMDPLLGALPGGRGGERYRDALRRAAEYFNAHPYLTALAVGALARVEHQGLPGEQIERLRKALVGPLGSTGDALIWAGALPAAVGLGLVVAVTATPTAGVLAFLLSYNVVHVALRTWALAAGWRHGREVARAFHGPRLQWARRLAGPVAGLSAGVALPLVTYWLVHDLTGPAQLGVAAVAGMGIALGRWVLPALGGLRYGLLLAALALGAGWLWR